MSEWISVKDKLPKHYGWVIAWSEHLGQHIVRYENGIWYLLGGKALSGNSGSFTHWMPLPEPPKTEGPGEPFYWESTDKSLTFRESDAFEQAIALDLCSSEYTVLCIWLNRIWAKYKLQISLPKSEGPFYVGATFGRWCILHENECEYQGDKYPLLNFDLKTAQKACDYLNYLWAKHKSWKA